MSFVQRLAHDSDDELNFARESEREHRAVVPRKQFKKSLASKGRREFQILERDARKREMQILARNYVHQLANKLHTRVSSSALNNLQLFRECIETLCGDRDATGDDSGVDVEVRRELMGDVTEYAEFLRDLLRQRKLADEEEEQHDSSSMRADGGDDTGGVEYFKVGSDHHRQTFIVDRESLCMC